MYCSFSSHVTVVRVACKALRGGGKETAGQLVNKTLDERTTTSALANAPSTTRRLMANPTMTGAASAGLDCVQTSLRFTWHL